MGYADVGSVRWRNEKLRGMMPLMRWRLAACLALTASYGCNLPTGSGPGLEPPLENPNFGNASGGAQGPSGSPNQPIAQPPTMLDPSDQDQLNDPLAGEGGGAGSAMPPDDGVAGTTATNTGGMTPDPEPPPPPNGAGSSGNASPPPLVTDAGSQAPDASAPPQGSVSCDPQLVLCDVEPEPCEGTFQVRQVVDGCYGECVPIEACACAGPEACPDADQYTCLNSQGHCSPYLN